MKKICALILSAFLFAALSCHPLSAQPLYTPIPKTVKTSPFSPIADQIQSLITGSPSQQPQAQPPAAAAPPAADTDTDNGEPQETFGTKALNFAIAGFQFVQVQGRTFIDNFAALPSIQAWFNQQTSDPKLQDRWRTIGDDILFFVGVPFAGAALLEMLLFLPRSAIRRRKPADFPRRLACIMGLFILRLLPVIAFVVSSLMLLNQNETQKFSRLFLLNIVYALTISRIVVAFIRSLLVPNSPHLRFIPISTTQVSYTYRWLCAFSIVIIYGYFFVDMARIVRFPATAITAFGNLLGLALVLMTMIVIVQRRAFIAAALRGHLSAAQPDLTLFQSLRLGVNNGFTVMLRGTILTLLLIAAAWLGFHATERWGTRDTTTASAMHHTILRCLVRLVIWVFVLIGGAAAWGADIPKLFATPLGQRVLGSAFSIGITVVIVALAYEAGSSAIEKHLNRRDAEGKQIQASARMRTLLPMIRTAIFIVFAAVVSLVVLSEVGFNIGPLLAGAGILGVAVGFGSQTLVKDFLTGLFIVIENTIAIGDVVQIGTHKGTVEAMSIRTLRLRDADGSVHILPFSEVTDLVNMSKDFSYAVVDVGTGLKSRLNDVIEIVRSVGEELQKDPIYKRVIVEPVEVLGVESITDAAVLLRARIRTRPGKQWDVRRMFLMKVKLRMDAEGVEPPPMPGAPPKPIPPL